MAAWVLSVLTHDLASFVVNEIARVFTALSCATFSVDFSVAFSFCLNHY